MTYSAQPASPAPESSTVKWTIAGLTTFVVLAVFLVLALQPSAPELAPLAAASPDSAMEKVSQHRPTPLAIVNVLLNGSAGVLLVAGFLMIRRGRPTAHKRLMLTAFGLSSLFLVTYLLHHAQVGSVPFLGQGAIRILYYGLLIPHVLLAAAIVPLALLTLYRGYSGKLAAHRSIARVTLPLWLYVSFSGVAIFAMLYGVSAPQ